MFGHGRSSFIGGAHDSTNLGRESALLVVAHIEIPGTFEHQRPELLLFVGHARRQRHEVPVDVTIALLATETEDVDALGGQYRTERPSETVDDALNREVFLASEVVEDMFAVIDWRDQRVATLGGIPAQEGDVPVSRYTTWCA
jgi:hypothetical protein